MFAHRFKHECTLERRYQEPDQSSPYDSFFRRCVQYLRRITTVYRNVDSQRYYRSNAAFRKERKRHVTDARYKHVIHPFSLFARRLAILINVVWFAVFVMEPYAGTITLVQLPGPFLRFIEQLLVVLNVVMLVHVVITFYMGYTVDATRVVILRQSEIVKHYFRTYFVVDFVPAAASVMFYFGRGILHPIALLVLYEMKKLRYGRVKTFVDNNSMLLRSWNIEKSHRMVVNLFFVAGFFLHTLCGLLGHVEFGGKYYGYDYNRSWRHQYAQQTGGNPDENDSELQMFLRMYYSHMMMIMCHFFGCGTYQYETQEAGEIAVFALTLIIGLMFYLYTIAKILQLFGVVNISESKYEELHLQMLQFVYNKGFPKDLKKRITMYYDYKYNRKYFSEQRILDTLTEHLRMEVLLYSCRHLTEQVQIFKGMSKAAVGCVLALLKQEIYNPKDEIMSSHDEDAVVYFILYGTCGILLTSSRELMHIEDGHHFGEMRDIIRSSFFYKVVALEMTEVYKLEGKDVKFCCRTYPEIIHKLQHMAKSNVRHYNMMFALRGHEDEDAKEDILEELRNRRILGHRLKRPEILD